jgi:hypothetical protein
MGVVPGRSTRSLAIMQEQPVSLRDRGALVWLGSVGIASAVVLEIWPLATSCWSFGAVIFLWSMKDHPIPIGAGFSSWRMSFNRVEALLFSTGIVLMVVPMLVIIAEVCG